MRSPLPRYAEAQLALAKHGLRLLTTGIPDRGPTQLPLEYRRLLDELAARPTEDGGLTREEAFAPNLSNLRWSLRTTTWSRRRLTSVIGTCLSCTLAHVNAVG